MAWRTTSREHLVHGQSRKNYIGKLDPKTGGVTEYPMPEPAARGPHTPIFDQKGTLWFTLQVRTWSAGSCPRPAR